VAQDGPRKLFGAGSKLAGMLKRAALAPPAGPSPAPAARGSANLEQVRALKQQGQLPEAQAACQQLLAGQPEDVEALLLLAETSVALGDREQAVQHYAQVIELRPDQPLAYYKRANLLKDRGDLEMSLTDYDRAITLDPHYAYALCNRGVVLSRLERLDEALESYERALAIIPDDVLAIFNRADLLRQLQRPAEALAGYDRAISVRPDHLESFYNRGLLFFEHLRIAEALASFDRVVALEPDYTDAHYRRGLALLRLQKPVDALAAFDRAIALEADHALAHFNRGVALHQLGLRKEAMDSLDKSLALRPGYPDAHLIRASIFLQTKQYAEAIQEYEPVIAFRPDMFYALGLQQYCKLQICDWNGLADGIEQLAGGIRGGLTVSSPLQVLGVVDDESVHHESARIWVRAECPSNHSLSPLPRRARREKIRVGYFSGDFYDHAVAVLSAELFESHDRNRFEITAFSLGPDTPSPMRQRLEKAFDRFVEVRGRPAGEIAELARNHEIDIAVDLSGYTENGNPEILAHRAAPIQVNYLGYPGTLGAEYVDYLIADTTVIPPENQKHYSEKIVYLPHSYLPNDSTRPVDAIPARAQAGLPADVFVFCCFNLSYKILPEVFSSWMRILSRVDRSVLWLSQTNALAAANLQREAEQRGVDSRRLVFAKRTPTTAQNLARLALADLALDTLPYNAHATSMDALWTGVPIVTRIGRSFAGRVAASLLRSVGLPELVTTSAQQYEDLAVELAGNPARLAEIRQRLADNRWTTPLFDSRAFVRDLETAYAKIYERYCAGLAPDHIHVAAAMR
jgi:predicted O-linked N-acetylglucosamine transferase (SPINDLY family)